MSRIKFRTVRLSPANRQRLDQVNRIIGEYQGQGYVLTLRQLYYQLVSRDVIPNNVKEYAKLSTLLKEGRMGGIVDWNAIEDRLRKPSTPASFDGPEDILNACINQYALPRMEGQPTYIEVWVEKDALSGVLKRVTQPFHIPILVNRGYSSASSMFDSYKRIKAAHEAGQNIRILYLGDFDPSGVDMIRDVETRICEFFLGDANAFDNYLENTGSKLHPDGYNDVCLDEIGLDFQIVPIALTKKQIKQYNPPPNPAKKTDPRSRAFIAAHGSSSWEVDALKPEVLNKILTDGIMEYLDGKKYNAQLAREKKDKKKLESLKQYL